MYCERPNLRKIVGSLLASVLSVVSLGAVSVMIMGCTHSLSATSGSTEAASTPAPVSLGQSLPLSVRLKVGDQIILLEVAQTPEQQQMGLMHRTSLASDRGMVFPFSPARRVGFWMQNVLINLDMVFVRAGKIVAIESQVPPCTAEPCAIYGPDALVDQVIELRGGRASELGIKVGDHLIVEPYPSNSAIAPSSKP